MSIKTEKSKEVCVKEVVEVMKKLVSLGIPLDAPEVLELRSHFDAYIKEGICWNGTIDFPSIGRKAEVNLPKKENKTIEITLRVL